MGTQGSLAIAEFLDILVLVYQVIQETQGIVVLVVTQVQVATRALVDILVCQATQEKAGIQVIQVIVDKADILENQVTQESLAILQFLAILV